MRFTALVAAIAFALPVPVMAQDKTLADIRSELSVLYRDILSIKKELDPSGLQATVSGSNGMLDRVVSIEQSLQVLTART